MMLLPTPVNRASLRGFWIFVSLGIGLLAVVILAVMGNRTWGFRILIGLLLAVLVATPCLIRPTLAWWPYRAWNWTARRFSRLAIGYTTAVAFRTALLALSHTGRPASFERSLAGESTWSTRSTQSEATYPNQHHYPTAQGEGGNWYSELATWRRGSRHRGAWALTPFLAMIRAVDTDPVADQSAPRNIYTLY